MKRIKAVFCAVILLAAAGCSDMAADSPMGDASQGEASSQALPESVPEPQPPEEGPDGPPEAQAPGETREWTEAELPVLPEWGETLEDFIPAYWVVEDLLELDYNGDGLTDYVGSLLLDGEGCWSGIFSQDQYSAKRLLFTISGHPEGGFQLDLQDNHILWDWDEGGIHGNPFKAMETDGTNFATNYRGGSGVRAIRHNEYTFLEGEWRVLCEYYFGWYQDDPADDVILEDYRTGVRYHRERWVEYEAPIDPVLPKMSDRSLQRAGLGETISPASLQGDSRLEDIPEEVYDWFTIQDISDEYLLLKHTQYFFFFRRDSGAVQFVDSFAYDELELPQEGSLQLDPYLGIYLHGDSAYVAVYVKTSPATDIGGVIQVYRYPVGGGEPQLLLEQETSDSSLHYRLESVSDQGFVLAHEYVDVRFYDLEGNLLRAIPASDSREITTDVVYTSFQPGYSTIPHTSSEAWETRLVG